MNSRSKISRRAIASGLAALGATSIFKSAAAQSSTDVAPRLRSVLDRSPAFPLAIKPGGRYLVDRSGAPFLIHGDSAWSLIADLRREEALEYLEDRRSRGFNALLVNLIEHRFATKAPSNAYGKAPFRSPGDFRTPDDEYFSHAKWVVRQAAEKGFLVLLVPAYLGFDGGIDGWCQEMRSTGVENLKYYGGYVGQKFSDCDNIMWVMGGDYNPPDKDIVRSIAEGIRKFDKTSLLTAHTRSEFAALDHWAGEPWLQVNNVFTYKSVRDIATRAYNDRTGLPFFLVESAYENEYGATEYRVRVQAYQALLSGAAGQFYGNNPIWHFAGPGLFPAPTGWREALGSRGAQSMTNLRILMESLPWWDLRPAPWLLAGQAAHGDNEVVASQTSDRALALLYLPTEADLRIKMNEMAGTHAFAQWFDPASGEFSPPLDIASAASVVRIRPKGRNSANLKDWALVLKAGSVERAL